MTSSELIRKVWEHPALWDRNDRTYRNKPLKERLWERVASELGCSAKVCQVKWKSLRDRYAKEVKKEQTDQPTDPDEKKWLYYDNLQFLKDTLCPRAILPKRSSSDTKSQRLPQKDDCNSNDINEEETVGGQLTHDEDTLDPLNAFIARSHKINDATRRADSPASSLTEIPPGYANFFEELATVIKQKQEDECDIFGKFVAAKMRKIPDGRRGQLENFIVKYLNDEIERLILEDCIMETNDIGDVS